MLKYWLYLQVKKGVVINNAIIVEVAGVAVINSFVIIGVVIMYFYLFVDNKVNMEIINMEVIVHENFINFIVD